MEELAESMNKQHRKCYANDVNDDQLTPLFRQWAVANFCMENVDFYVDVVKYKRNNSLNMKQEAEIIFRRYIAIGAPQEININYLIRVHIMRGMVDPKTELFDEAQAHIFELMQVDCFPRFFRSEPFMTRYKPIPDRYSNVLPPKTKGPPPMMQDTKSRASSLKTFLKRAVRPTSADFATRMHRSQSAVDAREGVELGPSEYTSDWRETLRATLRGTIRSTRQSRAYTAPAPISEEIPETNIRPRAETAATGYYTSPPMSPVSMFSPPLSSARSLPFSPHTARMSLALPQGAHHRHSKSEPFVIPKGLRPGVVIIGYERERRKARAFDDALDAANTTTQVLRTTELSTIAESSTSEQGTSGSGKVEMNLAKSIVECILESMIESAATKSIVAQSAIPEPAVTEPAVTEPAVTEPAVTEPAVTEPAVTEPAVTEPAVPEPAVPEPAVPEPAVPEPAPANEPTTTDTTIDPASVPLPDSSAEDSSSESSGSDGSSSPAHVDVSEGSSSKTSVSDYGYTSNTDSGSYGYSSSAESGSTSASQTGTTTASYVPYAVAYEEEKESSGKKSRFSKMFQGKFNFLFHHKTPISQTKSTNRRRHSTALYVQSPENNTKLGAKLSLITSPPSLRKRRDREI